MRALCGRLADTRTVMSKEALEEPETALKRVLTESEVQVEVHPRDTVACNAVMLVTLSIGRTGVKPRPLFFGNPISRRYSILGHGGRYIAMPRADQSNAHNPNPPNMPVVSGGRVFLRPKRASMTNKSNH